jgi:hypothetical protein
MNDIRKLILVFDAFAALTGQAEATVSTKFLGNGNRIREIRDGGDMGSRRIARALAQFSAHWPVGAAWPEGVERPSAGGED